MAQEIRLEGEVIGWLVVRPPSPEAMKDQPIFRRLDTLYLYGPALGSTVLALVLSLVFSPKPSRPLLELSAAAKIVKGRSRQKVAIGTKDEIGELARSFNQMLNDLERLMVARKQLTADIAHELRTPISVILGYADGVADKVLEPSLEKFEIIRDEALHLERMVNDPPDPVPGRCGDAAS